MIQNHSNRTARTSGEDLFIFLLVIAPSFRELELPANPVPFSTEVPRLKLACIATLDVS